MPALNRTRVANTNFNEGFNRFDDFNLDLAGTNTVIDLENGQGKTLFLQCISQTIYPNAKFSVNWPVSALFQGKNDNRAMHCMTEWILDEGSEYKYALVGFCGFTIDSNSADEELADIEDSIPGQNKYGHIKYICFYNEPNSNDIREFPLYTRLENGHKKAMSPAELVNYLRKLQNERDSEYAVVISPTKKAHFANLAQININAFEWEFMFKLNKDEASTYLYYAQFTSAASFIKDCLIPLVESSNQLKIGVDFQDNANRAKLLMDLQETLRTLQEKQETKSEYVHIKDFCNRVSNVVKELKKSYAEEEEILICISALAKKIERLLRTNKEALEENEELRKLAKEEELSLNDKKDKVLHNIQLLNIIEIEEVAKRLKEVYQEATKKTKLKEVQHEKIEDSVNRYECEQLYAELLATENLLQAKTTTLDALSKSSEELLTAYKESGNVCGNILLQTLRQLKEQQEQLEDEQKSIQEINEQTKKQKYEEETLAKRLVEEITELKDKVEFIQQELREVRGLRTFLTIETAKKELKETEESLMNITNNKSLLEKQYLDIKLQTTQAATEKKNNIGNIKQLEKSLQIVNQYLSIYEENEKKVVQIKEKYAQEEVDKFLAEAVKNWQDIVAKHKHKTEQLEQILEDLKKDKGLSISANAIHQYEVIAKEYPSAIWGSELLNGMEKRKKEELLKRVPLLMYAVLLENSDFKNFQQNKRITEKYKDELIPIINNQAIDEQITTGENILFTAKPVEYFLDVDERKKQIARYERELKIVESELKEKKKHLSTLEQDQKIVHAFILQYPIQVVLEKENERQFQKDMLHTTQEQLNILESMLFELETKEKENTVAKEELNKREKELLEEKIHIENQILLFEKENKLTLEERTYKATQSGKEKELYISNNKFYESNEKIKTTNIRLTGLKNELQALNK